MVLHYPFLGIFVLRGRTSTPNMADKSEYNVVNLAVPIAQSVAYVCLCIAVLSIAPEGKASTILHLDSSWTIKEVY